MCYEIQGQNKNAEKLNRKLEELNFPIYMRKYFTVKYVKDDTKLFCIVLNK